MTLHVIVAAYDRPIAQRCLIDSFLLQTNPNWKMYVVHDGLESDEVKAVQRLYSDPRIGFYHSDIRYKVNGNMNRRLFLAGITGSPNDFVLITNGDNYYVPYFVDLMLQKCIPGIGLVYCDTLHSFWDYDVLHSKLQLNFIDMGSFIVRLSIAQENGFNNVERMDADGLFAEECTARCASKNLLTAYIPKALFVHN